MICSQVLKNSIYVEELFAYVCVCVSGNHEDRLAQLGLAPKSR